MDPLRVGCLVGVSGLDSLGTGKLVDLDDDSGSVEWFRSVADREQGQFDLSEISRALPSPETRCYVCDALGGNWRMGRIHQAIRAEDGNGWEYAVLFPGEFGGEYVHEDYMHVRCRGPVPDPLETLVLRAHETPFFHERRGKLMASLVEQRAASEGLTGLLSSRIELFPHQIEVVRRVLSDPVQRYLLADEVGLGKTIEAGVVLRQLFIDDPALSALIVVPEQLRGQWSQELEERFGLSPFMSGVSVITTPELTAVASADGWDIVVIDEAHHLASTARSENGAALWGACREICHSAPRLLLLSATPALRNERDFLAMLHLLEPETYDLTDLERFSKSVRDRQPIGRLLLRLEEGTPRPLMRMVLGDLRVLFADDGWLLGKTTDLEACCGADDFDQEAADAIVRAIRVHICETHRVYRRMLRTSRALLDEKILADRSSEFDHPLIDVEPGFDDRLTQVDRCLDEWREAAAASTWSRPEGEREDLTERLARVLAAFTAALGTDTEVLRQACEARLRKGAPGHPGHDSGREQLIESVTCAPLFSGEEDFLKAVLVELDREPGGDGQVGWLVECVKHHVGTADRKLSVFSCYTSVAHELAQALRERVGATPVAAHLHGMDGDAQRAAVSAVQQAHGAAVLVCDSSGEEGVNLQFTDRLLHFDLPSEPNRLEQRIGRVDRIGRKSELVGTVFIGSDYEHSIIDAWYQMLSSGLGVFSESIADLQFYVERAMPELWRIMLMEGPGEFVRQVPRVREEVQEERRLLREQTVLDEIQAFEEETEGIAQRLIEHDRDWTKMQEAFEAWAVDALHLQPWVPDTDAANYDDDGVDLEELGQPRVEYRVTDHSLVNKCWGIEIGAAGAGPGSFSREIALAHPGTAVYRLGHPLIDRFEQLMRCDDRGQASALWRYAAKLRTGDDHLYFELSYAIEADVAEAIGVAEALGLGLRVQYALRRQGDAWFPPLSRGMYVDSRPRLVKNEKLIKVLQLPYAKEDAAWVDYNLNHDRIWALEELVAADRWEGLCRDVRDVADATLAQDRTLARAIEAGARHASHALERRMDQLRRGLVYRAGFTESGGKRAIQQRLLDEERLYSALISGIKEPTVRLDSIRATVLSARNPFEDE